MARQLTNRQAKRSRKSKGFTLIELMVVTAIAGVLGAVAVPKFLQAREVSEAKAAVAEMVGVGKECITYLTSGGSDSGMTQPAATYLTYNSTAGALEKTTVSCTDNATGTGTDYKKTISGKFPEGIWCIDKKTAGTESTVTINASTAAGLACTLS